MTAVRIHCGGLTVDLTHTWSVEMRGGACLTPAAPDTCLCVLPGSSILAILLLIVFLESVEDRMENEREAGPRSPPLWSTLLATFMLFKNDKRLRLLILLPLYSGMNQGFMNGEYTKVGEEAAQGCVPVPYLKGPEGVPRPGARGPLGGIGFPVLPRLSLGFEAPVSNFSAEGRTSYWPMSSLGRARLVGGSC